VVHLSSANQHTRTSRCSDWDTLSSPENLLLYEYSWLKTQVYLFLKICILSLKKDDRSGMTGLMVSLFPAHVRAGISWLINNNNVLCFVVYYVWRRLGSINFCKKVSVQWGPLITGDWHHATCTYEHKAIIRGWMAANFNQLELYVYAPTSFRPPMRTQDTGNTQHG